MDLTLISVEMPVMTVDLDYHGIALHVATYRTGRWVIASGGDVVVHGGTSGDTWCDDVWEMEIPADEDAKAELLNVAWNAIDAAYN